MSPPNARKPASALAVGELPNSDMPGKEIIPKNTTNAESQQEAMRTTLMAQLRITLVELRLVVTEIEFIDSALLNRLVTPPEAMKMALKRKRPGAFVANATRARSEHFPAREIPNLHISHEHDIQGAELIFTAIPRGTFWTLKVLDADGGTVRFGNFVCRADAMRMATRLADSWGGMAVP